MTHSLLAQATLLETMLRNGLVEAYRKHRRLRPAEDAAISESLWASVHALREVDESIRGAREAGTPRTF